MTGLEKAVTAYIEEHGSITAETYSGLKSVFLEYRDPKADGPVEAGLSTLEQRKELSSKWPAFSKSMYKFYTETLIDECKKQIEKRTKDSAKIKEAVSKCEKKAKEQFGLFNNVLSAAVKELPGLPQHYGEKLVKLMSKSGEYDIGSHKTVITLCKNAMSAKDKIAATAGQFLDAAKNVAINALMGASIIALSASLIFSAGALAKLPTEEIVGVKSDIMTQEEYDKEVETAESGKNMAALAIGGLPLGAALVAGDKAAKHAKKKSELNKQRIKNSAKVIKADT